MKKKKKLIKKTDTESELVNIIADMLDIINSKTFSKSMANNLVSTFADVLKDSPSFHKILADPESDLARFEPVIKKLLKKKK